MFTTNLVRATSNATIKSLKSLRNLRNKSIRLAFPSKLSISLIFVTLHWRVLHFSVSVNFSRPRTRRLQPKRSVKQARIYRQRSSCWLIDSNSARCVRCKTLYVATCHVSFPLAYFSHIVRESIRPWVRDGRRRRCCKYWHCYLSPTGLHAAGERSD